MRCEKVVIVDLPQYTATLLDPCVANRAFALDKIDAVTSANASCRVMIAQEGGRACKYVTTRDDNNDSERHALGRGVAGQEFTVALSWLFTMPIYLD